ncbi:MAG: DNA polymerase III subunit alpha, partial [bacterium]|nr:DNA polymerase III subunit alpha [bacterium]
MRDFVHLHVHSHYSLLDGLPKIPDLVGAVKAKGMGAVALTDHGALYGAIEFYKLAKRNGIKPIIGIEAYIAPGNLSDKKSVAHTDYFHLLLLARNIEGYRNLMQLVTISNLEGFYYRPRIDKTVLKRHRAGLIGLSGCLRGEIPRNLLTKKYDTALKVAKEYSEIFEPGNFFLEVQRNSQDVSQEAINQQLVRLSRECGLPLVATNDSHYLSETDKAAQDILVCIGTGRTVHDTDRLDMRSFDLSLKSPEEMHKLFADLPEALENTLKIASLVDLDLALEKRRFPDFPVPDGFTSETYFDKLCRQGLRLRQSGTEIPPEIAKRLEYEMDIIKKKDFTTYFLVVADMVNWARKRGIISTTRGSAAGSLAAYALGITTTNPIEYKLPFERFLNPYRPTPPDIDMDFADNRRDEVLQYVSEKYGKNKVAQIVTFGTMMARAAVRDVGRALGVAYSKCDKIAKMIPFGKQGFQMTIEKALTLSPDLKTAYERDPETKNLLELAKKVEGSARHASVHAAGVVIAPTNLTEFTPLQLDTENKNIITQYDMRSVEDAGLVKMDFLGIRNLSILGNAIEITRQTRGINIDLQKIPLDDKKTFALLATGKTMGVFQLGGSGMTRYLVELKPTNIFDIMAMISLYRPGPMESIPEFIARKHDSRLISYLDPRLEDILDMSYGVITYQEDVLLTAINVAGYTWEEADKLRKAMGKKIPFEMAAQKEKFIQGAISGGMNSQKAIKLWSLIEPFAAYGFGKAHAASYAFVAYQTAYMKANFPVEFMAALMTAEAMDSDKIALAVNECANLGIEVLPPDINESLADFTIINNTQIRFGLSAVKNLGSDVILTIIAQRKEAGQFMSLADFVKRMNTRNFNKKSFEALVKSGSLDRYGERNQLLLNTEIVLAFGRDHQKQRAAGQSTLFAENQMDEKSLLLKDAPAASPKEILSWEKEFLGLYVSSHPLDDYREILASCRSINTLTSSDENSRLTVGGIITRIQNILTKKGEPMCFADLEDFGGKLELVVFPSIFNEYKGLLANDSQVIVYGRISDKDGEIKMLVEKITPIENASKAPSPPREGEQEGVITPNLPGNSKILKIKIPKDADPHIFSKLKTAFGNHPGQTPITLVIPDREGTLREIKTDFAVENSDEFKIQLKQLLKESIKE